MDRQSKATRQAIKTLRALADKLEQGKLHFYSFQIDDELVDGPSEYGIVEKRIGSTVFSVRYANFARERKAPR